MDTGDRSIPCHFWKCSHGHQNATELSAQEREQDVILLRCWVAGCPAQRVISRRTSSSRVNPRSPQRPEQA